MMGLTLETALSDMYLHSAYFDRITSSVAYRENADR